MAIYDPPDGSVDPRPRCTGHCCQCFSLEYPYKALQKEVERLRLSKHEGSRTDEWKNESYGRYEGRDEAAAIADAEQIHAMLIPLGKVRGQELFTCRHFDKDEGNCTIYETRPQMCRDFPGPNLCPYRNCASHGPQNIVRRIFNWLRD